jgi:outer membrane protein
MMLRKVFCNQRTIYLTGCLLLIVIIGGKENVAAQTSNTGFSVSLSEAVQFAKTQNKWVMAARMEESAAGEDRHDAYQAALPAVNVSSSYQRFSDLTLYTQGLSNSSTGQRRPTANAAALGIDALFNIYNGGRQRAFQKEQTSREYLAKLNADDQSGNIGLQTATQYLNLVRLADLKRFVLDQLNRANTRLTNIKALYKNQKVTKSDVLRAEVTLSNVQLSLQQTENDINITNQRLDVLMNIPDSVRLVPTDSAGMSKPKPDSLLQIIERAGISSYSVRKAMENVELQKARVSGIKSSNKPSLAFYTAYGLNYPNYLFFPPVDQAYSVGFVGLKAQYSISSLYHNKSKKAAGMLRVKELEIQKQATTDNVITDIKTYYIKYIEALNRISVNERSVEQSRVNYRIVSTKYYNQLALLIDLLDADNLYQESRFNLIKAQTDALTIYYHILYTSGNL